MSREPELQLACGLRHEARDTVLLGHGGGGRLMRQLLEQRILPRLAPAATARGPLQDSAVLPLVGARWAFTTDSFVVRPLFFPGGDIGKLAVCGTVNDLAMAGARPEYLSCGLILEEGMPLDVLDRVLESMQAAAESVGVPIVTGDTKVVERGKGDGVFINTAGLGRVGDGFELRSDRVREGDQIILSGDIGRHGIAVMSVREQLELEGVPASDCAPLDREVQQLAGLAPDIRCLRDLTRGGLAAALVEIASDAGVGIELNQAALPVHPAVANVCELLGLDPLHIANEGRFVAFVAPQAAEDALRCLNGLPRDHRAVIVGTVGGPPDVRVGSPFGTTRLVELPATDPLPRIC